MSKNIILEPRRLDLREIEQSDYAALCEILQDNVAKRNGMTMCGHFTKYYYGMMIY